MGWWLTPAHRPREHRQAHDVQRRDRSRVVGCTPSSIRACSPSRSRCARRCAGTPYRVVTSWSADSRAASTIFLRSDGSTSEGIAASTVSTNLRTASIAARCPASTDSSPSRADPRHRASSRPSISQKRNPRPWPNTRPHTHRVSRFQNLANVSLVGRPFRVENGVVVALSTPFLYGPSRP